MYLVILNEIDHDILISYNVVNYMDLKAHAATCMIMLIYATADLSAAAIPLKLNHYTAKTR